MIAIINMTGENEMIDYFMQSWQKCKCQEAFEKIMQVKEILADEESKKVLEARIEVYETGNISLLQNTFSASTQYFNPKIKFTDDEYFIDLGAYKVDTIESFIKHVNGNYKKIIAFEPDHENMLCLNRYILERNINNVIVYKLASWDKKETLNFFENGSYISQIQESGNSSTCADSLDNILFDAFPVTFIKMDVEGAECKTIEGAQSLIKKYKPKLAICVYHRADHIYEIPLTIKKLVPEYKLYLRHHSDSLLDTVLYAVI